MNNVNESQVSTKKLQRLPVKGKKLRFKSVQSIIGQYIKGRIRASDISGKPKPKIIKSNEPRTETKPRIESTSKKTKAVKKIQKSIVFQPCNAPRPDVKFYQKNIEICAPDILCVNLVPQQSKKSSEEIAREPNMVAVSSPDKKIKLTKRLDELTKISAENETQISAMIEELNRLKLSVSLLSEEQQKLEHSNEIRAIGLKLLNNMLKSRSKDSAEKPNCEYEQYEKERQIVEKILEQLARLEKVKMKLEYENIRNLCTIRELKKHNAQLEKIKADLLKELNSEGT